MTNELTLRNWNYEWNIGGGGLTVFGKYKIHISLTEIVNVGESPYSNTWA